jgi:MoxR-like ATPase
VSGAVADPRIDLGRRLTAEVLEPMKAAFVGKDEVIDLLGVSLAAGENLFIIGPPGTAKSALVHELGRRLNGRTFDYLLTRFTEPNELFGPFDIRRLREGELVTNTEGMLPEASLVFLDELLNANSAILNSLLTVLNERVFRRGRETRALPTVMVVGASNHLPEDDALGALFDRFLMRVHCDNVPDEQLADVLDAGWKLELDRGNWEATLSVDEVGALHGLLQKVDFDAVRGAYVDLIQRLRTAGIAVSDRRAVKLQRLVAASAILCGRTCATAEDLWIFRYIWDREEQREVLNSIVGEFLARAKENKAGDGRPDRAHPRSRTESRPDPEALARDLERLDERLQAADLSEAERSRLRDRLGALAARCEWVVGETQREYLLEQVRNLFKRFEDER